MLINTQALDRLTTEELEGLLNDVEDELATRPAYEDGYCVYCGLELVDEEEIAADVCINCMEDFDGEEDDA